MDYMFIYIIFQCVFLGGGCIAAIMYSRKKREREYIKVEATIVDVEKERKYTERGSIVKYVPVFEYKIGDITKRRAISKYGVSEKSTIEIGKKKIIKVNILDKDDMYEAEELSIADFLQNPSKIGILVLLIVLAICVLIFFIRYTIELISLKI